MKIKTSEATNTQINWLVAKCEGRESTLSVDGNGELFNLEAVDGEGMWMRYSTNWTQGGPIIEREFITIDQKERSICACIDAPEGHELNDIWANGPTPLIAAMRCYVESKMGEVVEIPKELT